MQTDQIDYRQKWKQGQKIANMYWNRWLKEYIPTLTPRSKWTRQTRNFRIGDLVIKKSKYIPWNHWPLGRVIETFVGSDDIICSVEVKIPLTPLTPSHFLTFFDSSIRFVWRGVICLIFTIQHILTIFFLSEFSFESFIILLVGAFIYCPTTYVYQFIHYLFVVLKRNSSVKDLIYLFCLSKCFGRNNNIYISYFFYAL